MKVSYHILYIKISIQVFV